MGKSCDVSTSLPLESLPKGALLLTFFQLSKYQNSPTEKRKTGYGLWGGGGDDYLLDEKGYS